MTATMLLGKPVAEGALLALKARVLALSFPPKLVVLRAGDDKASASYVRSIARVGKDLGIEVLILTLPPETTLEGFRAAAKDVLKDPRVLGLQFQKPIPSGCTTSDLLREFSPWRDPEGVHPENLGYLFLARPRMVPCTAKAAIRLLEHYEVPIRGKRALVVGRSDTVGKPAASLLLARHATVTIAHTGTVDLAAEVARAEIIIACAGVPELVRKSWLPKHAVVVDVGHHVLDDGRTCGDVEAGAAESVAAISPVPGGVGPLTVVTLFENLLIGATMPEAGGT